MKKLTLLSASIAALVSATAIAAPVEVYLEQNVASNAADNGEYATEAGATIQTSEDGYVNIAFDDQGYLAAGYGYDFHMSDQVELNLYGELSKWDEGGDALAEAVVTYNISDNFNVFGGYAYKRSEEVDSDNGINSNQFIAGSSVSFGMVSLDYIYTHENSDGSKDGVVHIGNQYYVTDGDYHTNQHEVVLSAEMDNWKPYVSYTYLNTSDLTDQYGNINKNDNIVTLGLAYQF
ncbi:hypothetical protein [Vibrio breoganii]|uniref:hypothetical protein n=1 Tax=Vibrio breoganii TaxID=553239 RepID=UPI000C81F62F|nr:hypothetical protein [Vibrio breoganii]PMG91968.1 hypothetical protein BCU79_16265 [Vibrio breoganii]PMJ46941.1 hypothetical protein BCU21_08960 [Vibrio breoganii]PMK56048.1 hypothetical protein BCT97_12260 [Vibrio breoganii]PML32051.1 hypothetical protein BCT78_03130 [Vibrio breoganii]PML82432.1 hypothetical protein BCT68_13125 [Vibrio breoganii]